jgi:hypothetical protein
MKVSFPLALVLAFSVAFAAEAAKKGGGKKPPAKTACSAPNHISHSNPAGPHQMHLRTDHDAKLMGDECTLAKIKAVNKGKLPAWAAGTTICLPAECELGHASDEHNAATDRHAAGLITFKERLGQGKDGACRYLAHLSTWAKNNKVKAAMAGGAVHFATIDGICHFVGEGVGHLKPEWHLDEHTISTACAALATVTLAGAHAAAHGHSMCNANGKITGGSAPSGHHDSGEHHQSGGHHESGEHHE